MGKTTGTAAAEQAEPRLGGAPNGSGTPPPEAEAPRERRAYEFRDAGGHQARAWWGQQGWRVAANDPAFRRRITRALRQPISVWEKAVWADGVPSCTPVQVAPTDPRYLRGLPMAWGQLPLDDVDIGVVLLGDDEG